MRRVLKSKSKIAKDEIDRTSQILLSSHFQLRRTHERYEKQIAQLLALHRLSSTINTTFDLELILQAVCESMARDLDFEKSGIVFLEQISYKPLRSAYAGFSVIDYQQLLDHFEELLLPSLQQEDVSLQTGVLATTAWSRLLGTLQVSSLLLLPLRVKSRLIGFIVGARPHVTLHLGDTDRQFYSMVAAQTAAAIENSRLYEALGQANLTLEEKVVERTKNLLDANDRLRDLDQVKSNFIAMISHELRTPLTAIKGFAVTLYKYDKEISEEKRHVYLRVLNEETDRLTRLITELLDISKIESGRMDIQWKKISMPEVVQHVLESLSGKANANAVKLTSHFPADFPDMVADPDKLEQVFINLVTNAIRFTPANGNVTVSGYRHNNGVAIEVKDQGPGIPFSEQEKVFEKFYRIDNETNYKNPGTGLGLPICRALVNLHGGKIWVESEEKQGCRIIFKLPLNLDKKTEEATPSTDAASPPTPQFGT